MRHRKSFSEGRILVFVPEAWLGWRWMYPSSTTYTFKMHLCVRLVPYVIFELVVSDVINYKLVVS